MSWFSRKSKAEMPKQAEPPPPAPPPPAPPPPEPDFIVGESIIVSLKCMKCGDRFEIVMYLHRVQPAPGLCKRCHQVLEWVSQDQRYLEFLRIETEATRRDWIVRP